MRGDCISDNEGINARDAEESKMITGHTPPFSNVDRVRPNVQPATPAALKGVGPSTYLHAGASIQGWPANLKAEDAFDLPPKINAPVEGRGYPNAITPSQATKAFLNALANDPPEEPSEEREYRAEWGNNGEAFLVLDLIKRIATFDTYADAQLAAEALNNHKGY